MNENNVKETNVIEQNTNKNKTDNILKEFGGLISFITAIIPILLFIICLVLSKGENENGAGAIGWLLVIYGWIAAIPVLLISIVTGIQGIKGKTKILSILGLIVDIFIAGLIFSALYIR